MDAIFLCALISLKKCLQARLKTMQDQLDIAGPLVNYAAKGYKAALKGKDTVSGKEAYKIQLTNAAGKDITYYIDTKTNLLMQTRQMGDARP